MIGTSRLGTAGIPVAPRTAAAEPVVVRRRLVDPHHLAGVDVHRDDRVGHRLRRIGVRVARGHVDRAPLHIHRGRRPDAAAGGTERILTRSRVPAAKLRLVDGVGLPQERAGVRVERVEVSSERAARSLTAAARAFLVQSLHRHEGLAVLNRDRAGDRGGLVLIHLALPDLLAGDRVHRVRVRTLIAEEDGVARAPGGLVRSNRQRASNARLRLEGPVGAAGPRIQCVELAVVAGGKQLSTRQRRLHARRTWRPDTRRPTSVSASEDLPR